MSRWPIRRTWFYEEWLHEIVTDRDKAEQDAWLQELIPEGSVGVEGLIGMGATFREVS